MAKVLKAPHSKWGTERCVGFESDLGTIPIYFWCVRLWPYAAGTGAVLPFIVSRTRRARSAENGAMFW